MFGRGRNKSKTTRELGKIAEDHAARFLRSKGYRVITRNYNAPAGEIDIIAEHRGALVFIEVKSLSSSGPFSPRDKVNLTKQRRLAKAAAHYLTTQGGNERMTRFDIVEVSISPQGRVKGFNILPGVFEAG